MKRPRTATILGTITGLVLIAATLHALPGCTTLPPYIGIGFHFTTTPPTPREPATPAIAAAPSAAARP